MPVDHQRTTLTTKHGIHTTGLCRRETCRHASDQVEIFRDYRFEYKQIKVG